MDKAKYRLINQVADMTAEIDALRKELADANSFIESLSKLCQAAEARAIELQSSPQCGRCGKHSGAPHEGRQADSSPGVPLDVVVGPRR